MALVILRQLVIFAIMAGAGVIAVKTRVLDDTGLRYLSALVMRVTMPLMLLTTILAGATREQLLGTLVILPAGTAVVVLLYGLAALTARLCGVKGNRGRVFRAVASMGNNGFMGIPLAVALFPQLGALYAAVFTLVDQTACWTLGYYLCLPEEKLRGSRPTDNLRKILNPAIIAIGIALVMLLTGLRLPALLQETLASIGGVTSPLAMIYIGGLAAGLNIREAFTRRELYLIPLVKMVIAPILVFVGMRAVGVSEEITLFLTMITGTPAMASMAMFAQANGSEGDYAAAAVLLTTLACLFTMPLAMLVTGLL